MPFLNLENKLIIYADSNVENPKVRLVDITDSSLQVCVNDTKSQDLTIMPGESKEVANKLRTLGVSVDTAEFSLYRPDSVADRMRLSWTGSGGNPEFRVLRSTGVDATTQVSITRQGPRTMRIAHTGGTALDTSLVQTGDVIYLEKTYDLFTSPFNAANTGTHFLVQAKGVGYIDFSDEGGSVDEAAVILGSTEALKVFANPNPNKPKIGDSVRISASSFNLYNRGVFEITNVTDTYLEFVSPYGVAETVTNTVDGVAVFNDLINFFSAVSSGPLKVFIDSDTSGFQMSRLTQDKCVFQASVSAAKITLLNEGWTAVAVRCQHATISE